LLAVLAFVFVASGFGGEPEPLLQKRGLSRLFKNSEISALVAAAVEVVPLEKALTLRDLRTGAAFFCGFSFSVLSFPAECVAEVVLRFALLDEDLKAATAIVCE
jgi:hypothetical protein